MDEPDRMGAARETETDEIDLRAYLRILGKWRWAIALVTALAVITAGILSYFVLPPVYEASMLLMVANAAPAQAVYRPQDEGLQGVVNTVARLPQLTLNSYVSQLTSPTLLARVVTALKLDEAGYTAGALAGMVQARVVKDTNLVQVTVSNTDADLAVQIANTLSREFLAFISRHNQEQMDKSVQFLQSQAADVDRDLTAAAAKLTEFESQARGVAYLDEEIKAKTADLTRYQSTLLQAQVEQELLAAGIASLEERLAKTPQTIETVSPAPAGAANALGQPGHATGQPPDAPPQLSGREGALAPVKRVELNPLWVSLNESLGGKRTALAEKQAQAASLRQKVADLQEELGALQVEVTRKRATLDRLRADVERLRKTRDLLAEKITETRIARSINLGETNVLVVSPPVRPASPVKPNKRLNMAVAGVVGLMVGVALAFLLEYLDNTVKTPDDVQRQTGLPVLASIPVLTAEGPRR